MAISPPPRDALEPARSTPAGQGQTSGHLTVFGGFSGHGIHAEIRSARDLGRLIEKQRKALGYGLVDAAALCGVGTRFLFELEHGKATVEFDRSLRVAQRLGLRLKIELPGA